MIDSKIVLLNNYYDSLRRLLQITESYYSGFDTAFIEKDKIDSEIKKSVLEAIRKIQIKLFTCLDLIGNVLNTEDEYELQELLEKQELLEGVS